MAREVTDRRRRPGDRRVVRRHAADRATSRCARRIVVLAASCVRVGASAAQLEVDALPERPRQLERRRRKYLTDSTGLDVSGFIPALMDHAAATTRTASAACTSTCRGGATTRSSTSRAATTSSSAAGFGMPGYGFSGGIQNYPRAAAAATASRAQGRVPQVLRRVRRLRRPRREGRERGHATARSIRTSSIKYGIPVLRFHCTVERPRAASRPSTCRRPSARSSTRWAARRRSPMPTQEQDYGLAAGGLIIHEAGATRMGNDPKTVGAQRELPGARREEPVRRRRRRRSSRRPTRT